MSNAAEDRGNFAHGRAQALTLRAQGRIERSIVRLGRQNFLDQLAARGEPRMMRMGRRSPMLQETSAGGCLGPKQTAIFEPCQVLIVRVFA